MTEYVVTTVGEAGQRPLSLSVALGNEQQARQFASRAAQRCHGVTLESVDEDGAVASLARWLDGALTRNANGNHPMDSLRTAVQDFVDATDDTETAHMVSGDELANAADEDDEAHHFEGQCMKCKVKRAFVGRVVELSNGSRQARGHCPVCGTTLVRMVARTTPLDDADWEDDPEVVSEVEAEADAQDEDADVEAGNADMPLTDPETGDALDENSDHVLNREKGGRRGTHYTCTCGEFDVYARNETNAIANFEAHKAEAEMEDEISEAIAEVAEGAPIAEVAEATTELAAEFSHAAEEVEKPRKRAAKKANANSDGRTPNQRAAANPVKRHCAKCDQDVDTFERAGIQIFSLHPDKAKGLDRCPGSTTIVQG